MRRLLTAVAFLALALPGTAGEVASATTSFGVGSALGAGTCVSEADQDRHLVLRAGKKFMVGEIPDTKCVLNTARFHDEIHEVGTAFDDHFRQSNGKIRKSKKVVNERVRITGVGFFDSPHKVSNAAPNFIELHPVISIKFLSP